MTEEEINKIKDLLAEHLASHEIRDKKEVSRHETNQKDNKKMMREMDDRLKQAQKLRDDLLAYTLQIVTIIIGLFGLILSIIFLLAYRDELLEFQFWFIFSILILFTIIFISWFILWCWNKSWERKKD